MVDVFHLAVLLYMGVGGSEVSGGCVSSCSTAVHGGGGGVLK